MDRDLYKANMQRLLFDDNEIKPFLSLVEGSVYDLLVEDGVCVGISLQDGTQLRSKTVVITTGTFLGGQCHIGDDTVFDAGRFMRHDDLDAKQNIKIEPASLALSDSIKRLKFPVGRLRTGTPPRISMASIDYKGLEADVGDEDITWFSFDHAFKGFEMQQKRVDCFLTQTNEHTHHIIMSNYH